MAIVASLLAGLVRYSITALLVTFIRSFIKDNESSLKYFFRLIDSSMVAKLVMCVDLADENL